MYLISTGTYLPGKTPITNEMLSEIFGDTVKLVGDYFGVISRYFAVDYQNGKPRNEFNSDFCYKAAQNALAKKKLSADNIGLIICATNTPDYVLPQMSILVQEKLGIKNAITIDIRGGCSAPLQGLLIADNFIKQGLTEAAIVIGGECFSTIYYEHLLKNKNNFLAKDIMNSLIFGDGAAAFILSKNKTGGDVFEVEKTVSSSSFMDWPSGFVVSLGGSKIKHVGDPEISLGKMIKHFPKEIEKYLPKVIEFALKKIANDGYNILDFEYVVGPQANKRLIETLNNLFKKQSSNYFYYGDVTGNIPAGALLLAFDRLATVKEIKNEDKILIMGIESSKWMHGYSILRKVSQI